MGSTTAIKTALRFRSRVAGSAMMRSPLKPKASGCVLHLCLKSYPSHASVEAKASSPVHELLTIDLPVRIRQDRDHRDGAVAIG
jgi:hypothetical protein